MHTDVHKYKHIYKSTYNTNHVVHNIQIESRLGRGDVPLQSAVGRVMWWWYVRLVSAFKVQ